MRMLTRTVERGMVEGMFRLCEKRMESTFAIYMHTHLTSERMAVVSGTRNEKTHICNLL